MVALLSSLQQLKEKYTSSENSSIMEQMSTLKTQLVIVNDAFNCIEYIKILI